MARQQDLGCLGRVATGQKGERVGQPPNDQVDERQRRTLVTKIIASGLDCANSLVNACVSILIAASAGDLLANAYPGGWPCYPGESG
jgi:hypothetical protein